MTLTDLKSNFTPWLFSWLILLWVIKNEFLDWNLRFDLKKYHLNLKFQDPRFNLSAIWILQVDFLEILNISRTRNENLINFSTAKNPNITFWTDPRKFKNHRVPFSFKPPLSLANVKKSCMQQCDSFEMFFENIVCLHATS